VSGPKVVRIVTREELLEVCNGHLARIDSALAEWIRVGQRNECVDDQAIIEARRRRDALAALIASDRFMDLQKQAPAEEAFLRNDLQARLSKVAAERAEARMRERRESEAAATLLRTLRNGGKPIDPELERRLAEGDPGALAEGFVLLADRAVASSASLDLARKFRDERPASSFTDWLSRQPDVDSDPAVAKLEVRIAELEMLVSDGTAAGWRSRLNEAATAERHRRGLLLDGLEVETGRVLTDLRRRESIRSDLGSLLSELNAGGAGSEELEQGIDSLDAATLSARVLKARDLLGAHRAALAAAARRDAVLKQLSALGYEITEGMETTWAQEGRLVVRNATRPDYGVEVTAVSGNERMQMRAVAFDVAGRGPDTSRDRDAEVIWCGDLSTLQQRLAAVGGGLTIEKALPVGATALKRIALEQDRYSAIQGRTPGTRSIT
jgi:hypothetical protein